MKSGAGEFIGRLAIYVIGVLLLGYTAYRSYDILASTLPSDALVFGVMGIAGLDGGLLAWSLFYMHGARGGAQKGIALTMICVSLVGILFTVVGDSLMRSKVAELPEYVSLAVLWGVPVIIWTNVCAIVATHILDPERKIEDARRMVEHTIAQKRAQLMYDSADTIASEIAPSEHRQFIQEIKARYNGHERQLASEVGAIPFGRGKKRSG